MLVTRVLRRSVAWNERAPTVFVLAIGGGEYVLDGGRLAAVRLPAQQQHGLGGERRGCRRRLSRHNAAQTVDERRACFVVLVVFLHG